MIRILPTYFFLVFFTYAKYSVLSYILVISFFYNFVLYYDFPFFIFLNLLCFFFCYLLKPCQKKYQAMLRTSWITIFYFLFLTFLTKNCHIFNNLLQLGWNLFFTWIFFERERILLKKEKKKLT